MTVALGDLRDLFQSWLFCDSWGHINLPLCLDLNKFPSTTSPKNNIDAKNPHILMLFIPMPFLKENANWHRLSLAFQFTFQKKIKAKFLHEECLLLYCWVFPSEVCFLIFQWQRILVFLVIRKLCCQKMNTRELKCCFCGWERLPVAPDGRVKVTGDLQGPSHPVPAWGSIMHL